MSYPTRLQRGAPADVMILGSDGLAQLIVQGKVVKGSRVDLAESIVGMAAHAGTLRPNISSDSYRRKQNSPKNFVASIFFLIFETFASPLSLSCL